VDMLRRIVALAASTATADAENAGEAGTASGRANQAVPPTRVLDGFGAFSSPPPTARPIPANFSARANADLPPGAGAADARCAGGDCALRHTRRHAAAPPCGDNAAGGVPAERVDHAPSGAGAVLSTASTAVILAAARLRHEGGKSNASRLHHHRRCRRRRSKQSRPAGPHAIS